MTIPQRLRQLIENNLFSIENLLDQQHANRILNAQIVYGSDILWLDSLYKRNFKKYNNELHVPQKMEERLQKIYETYE